MATTDAALCERTRARLPRLLDGELEPADRSQVLSHLDACDPCRDEHSRLERALAALRGLPEDERARLRDEALRDLGAGGPPPRAWLARTLLLLLAVLAVWAFLRLRPDRPALAPPPIRGGADPR